MILAANSNKGSKCAATSVGLSGTGVLLLSLLSLFISSEGNRPKAESGISARDDPRRTHFIVFFFFSGLLLS